MGCFGNATTCHDISWLGNFAQLTGTHAILVIILGLAILSFFYFKLPDDKDKNNKIPRI